MSRFLKVATLAAVLAVSSFPATSQAALTESQAEAVAQTRQNPECGRGWDWYCDNKRFPEQQCLQGSGHWYCSGGVRQIHFSGFSSRVCTIEIWVASGTATLKDNWCF